MYRSGLFIWKGAFWEDVHGYKDNGNPVLSFIGVIYALTEFTLFLKRLYADALQVDDIWLSISLIRCKGRKLVALDPFTMFFGDHVSGEDFISIEETLKAVDLRAEYKDIAARFAKTIFQIFNWEDASDEIIEDWQRKLLDHKL